MSEEHARRVRDYLLRILPAPSGLESMGAAGLGWESFRPDGDDPRSADARDALDKIARDELPTPDETSALEAIVLPQGRPVIDIQDGTFTVNKRPWLRYGSSPFRERIERAIPAVGRLFATRCRGTAFLVGPDLVMTNRHVAECFVDGVGRRGLHFHADREPALDLKQELDRDESERLEVSGVVMIHPHWDMALLRVAPPPDQTEPLTLSIAAPEEIDRIAVLGYPMEDGRNNYLVQQRIFERRFDVKRLQPGHLTGRRTRESFGHLVDAATHDASTLGGNSGSAVIDVRTGHVAALHFAGDYLESNYAVPACDLASDPRVVDAGVRFGGTALSTDAWDEAWDRAERDDTPG